MLNNVVTVSEARGHAAQSAASLRAVQMIPQLAAPSFLWLSR